MLSLAAKYWLQLEEWKMKMKTKTKKMAYLALTISRLILAVRCLSPLCLGRRAPRIVIVALNCNRTATDFTQYLSEVYS
jgi:hypothetical protein